MSFLSIRNLSVRLKKGPPLLRRVSLDVAAGEVRYAAAVLLLDIVPQQDRVYWRELIRRP